MKLYLYKRTNKATDRNITHFTRFNIRKIETDELYIIDARNGKTVKESLGELQKIRKEHLPLYGIKFEGKGPDSITQYYVTDKVLDDTTYQELNKKYIDYFKAFKKTSKKEKE